jgi:hypothetical protein
VSGITLIPHAFLFKGHFCPLQVAACIHFICFSH